MAGVAINICSSFLVTVHAPLHIVSINHFYRSILQASQAMANGAIHTALDVNPMRKDDKAWKFIHPLPWNLPACLYIFDNFKCLRPLTDCIA
jgi:hypothetical protein